MLENTLERLVPYVALVLVVLCLVQPSMAQEGSSLQETASDLQEADVPEWRVWMDKRRSDDNGGGNCTDNANCTNGECVSGQCRCSSGWAASYCTYERKEKLTAFLLELFIGSWSGASRFYLGYTGQGIGQIILWWGGCAIACISSCAMAVKELRLPGCVCSLLGSAAFIASAIWSLVMWILILTDDTDDSNGYSLKGF